MRRFIRWVIEFYRRPEVWMGSPIWAPSMIMPGSSPYWRLMATQDRPRLELASAPVAAPLPTRDPIAVARRRAQFRLVHPLQEARS